MGMLDGYTIIQETPSHNHVWWEGLENIQFAETVMDDAERASMSLRCSPSLLVRALLGEAITELGSLIKMGI